MAKSSGPAAPGDTTDEQPAEPEQLDEQPTTEELAEEPAETVVSFWRYTGGEQRVYPHVPVTVDTGDVIAWVGTPATDGRWDEHPGPATRDPDNAPRPAPVDGADDVTAQE